MSQDKPKVRNPCVGVCALDDNDVCIACRRNGREIAQWGRLSQEERCQVIRNVEQRFKDEAS